MDQISRLQDSEGAPRRNGNGNSITSMLQDSLKQSVDLPAYMSWQTLSSEVSQRLRRGSVRINHSNQLEFTSKYNKSEYTALLGESEIRQQKLADSSSGIYHSAAHLDASKCNTNNWQVGVFLLCNAALGVSTLNYPAAYDRLGGVVIATIVQLVVLVLVASTMLALVFCAELHNDSTYHDVLRSMCGKTAQLLVATSIMATCFGINVTYLVVIGDQFDRLFSTFVGLDFCETLWFNRNFIITLTACLFIWPICYFKRLDFLRYVSTIGIIAMIYVVFLNVYEYYFLDTVPGVIKTQPSSLFDVAAVLPIILFAYQSQEIVLPIYSSMEKPRAQNFLKSTIVSLGLLFIIYCTAGTYGYLTFGSRVIPDILMMYDIRDPVVAAGVVAIIVKLVSTYPPMMFCGRGALDGFYAEWAQLSAEAFIRNERRRRLTITTLWNLAVLFLAVVTPNITVALELLGSLAACNVFVFPGMCLVSMGWRHLNGYYYNTYKSKRTFMPHLEGTTYWTLIWTALLIYGFIAILFGLVMFAIVFVQVGRDILAHHTIVQSNVTSVCGIHPNYY